MKGRAPISVMFGAVLVASSACSRATAPKDQVALDGSAVILGRITSTSGLVVPGATAIVTFYADTIRVYDALACGGLVMGTGSQQLDALGDYRLEVIAQGAAGKKVCLQVTGDPHGLYSDIGIKRHFAGWLVLGVATANAAPPELHVNVRYTETP